MGYTISGNKVEPNDRIYIAELKKTHPNYTDDQLLEVAIAEARANSETTIILWDGADIHFSGSVTHECKGFGGIDFNGSNIYMPNYDGGNILLIRPDETEDITVGASDIGTIKMTNASLNNKVFVLDGSGNSDMCLGTRYGFDTVMYWAPTLKTGVDGIYETGNIFLTPETGTVLCKNVHLYPSNTFELRNGIIISNAGSNMSTLAKVSRSNTRIHNFVLNGRSAANVYHNGIFVCLNCFDIEVDHISGTNPITESLASGYFLLLGSVTNAYVHDCFVGDSLSWGAIGSNHLLNTVTERCYLNRWDCHYCQTGYNVIRNCVVNRIEYGVGDGVLSIENCIIKNNKTSASTIYSIYLREDIVGTYEGDIIIKGCIFDRGEQSANLYSLWKDAAQYAFPSNSALNTTPKGRRYIEKCQMPKGCKNILVIGSNQSGDLNLYANVNVTIKDSEINCSDSVVEALDSMQTTIKGINIEGCLFPSQCYITKLLTDTPVKVDDCDFGTNALKVTSNSEGLHVTDTKLLNITVDASSAKLVANGNVFSGAQTVSNFAAYALAGNIASDMASVNKHSN